MRIKHITQMLDLSAKKVNFIAPLFNKMHTDPNFLFGYKLCYVIRYQKTLLSKTLIQKIWGLTYLNSLFYDWRKSIILEMKKKFQPGQTRPGQYQFLFFLHWAKNTSGTSKVIRLIIIIFLVQWNPAFLTVFG